MPTCMDLFKGNSDSTQRATCAQQEPQCLQTGKYLPRFWFVTMGRAWRRASTYQGTKSSQLLKEEDTNISITRLVESRSYVGTWRLATYSSTTGTICDM